MHSLQYGTFLVCVKKIHTKWNSGLMMNADECISMKLKVLFLNFRFFQNLSPLTSPEAESSTHDIFLYFIIENKSFRF